MPKAIKKVTFAPHLEIYKIQRSKPLRRYKFKASLEERAWEQLQNEAMSFEASHQSRLIEAQIEPLSESLVQLMMPPGFKHVRPLDPYRVLHPPMATPFDAPWPHTEILPDSETRDLALVRCELTHATARTNYELRYINEKLKLSAEVWPKDSLDQQIRDYPLPSGRPTLAQLKDNLQSIVLNEEYPTFVRVLALSNWLGLSNNPRCYFDLVEKAKAMLHEVKFRIQGDNDWNKVRWLQRNLEERLAKVGSSKDEIPQKPGFQAQLHRLPYFIQHSFEQWQEYVGWDSDMSFAHSFGIKTSKATLGSLDEQHSVYGSNTNGRSNGHANDICETFVDEMDDDSSDLEEISAGAFEASQSESRDQSVSQVGPVRGADVVGDESGDESGMESQVSYLDDEEVEDGDDEEYDEEYDQDGQEDQGLHQDDLAHDHQNGSHRFCSEEVEEEQMVVDSDELEIIEEVHLNGHVELDGSGGEEYDSSEGPEEVPHSEEEDCNGVREDTEDIESYDENEEGHGDDEENGDEDQ